MERAVQALVVRARDFDNLALLVVVHLHVGVVGHFELALGAFNAHLAFSKGDFHVRRIGHGICPGSSLVSRPTAYSRIKPSARSTCAMAAFPLVDGMSTTARSIRFALRIRVSMSAIGSVIMGLSSPARLLHTGNQTIAGQITGTDTTYSKLPVNRTRA